MPTFLGTSDNSVQGGVEGWSNASTSKNENCFFMRHNMRSIAQFILVVNRNKVAVGKKLTKETQDNIEKQG